MKDNQIKITAGVSRGFLESLLTNDVSTLDAIYDLIDNSIDAARNAIFTNGDHEKDKFGLPSSYSGYKINISISDDEISIEDNCFGMDEETLTSRAFVIASGSEHTYGIGQYGIGLKRSLLKMGRKYHFVVDNGEKVYKGSFTDENIGGEGNIIAEYAFSMGAPKTAFVVTGLKQEIKGDTENQRWLNNALEGLQNRYSIYFEKGLEVSLKYFDNPVHNLQSHLPKIRANAKFLPTYWSKEIDGVSVIIESGIHEKYLFPIEEGHSIADNRKLTDEFGIYFVCNDRVIVISSTAKSHGWSTKWHSEYNGFVCIVRFIAKQPSKLPWNTAKSAMREDAPLFLQVIDELQPIADNYRSEIKSRYSKKKRKKESEPSVNENNASSRVKNVRSNVSTSNTVKPEIKVIIRPEEKLHREREIFVDWNKAQTRVPKAFQKSYDTYFELCQLSSKNTPIACMATLRVFIERTFKDTGEALGVNYKNNSLNGKAKTLVSYLYNNRVIDKRLYDIVTIYTSDGLSSINNLQDMMHSKETYPTHSMMNKFWDELDPFLAACWKAISDTDF